MDGAAKFCKWQLLKKGGERRVMSNQVRADESQGAEQSATTQLLYPAVFHFRIITVAEAFNVAELVKLLADYQVTAPLTAAGVSTRGRYQAYSLALKMSCLAEMQAFDGAVKLIPGVQVVL